MIISPPSADPADRHFAREPDQVIKGLWEARPYPGYAVAMAVRINIEGYELLADVSQGVSRQSRRSGISETSTRRVAGAYRSRAHPTKGAGSWVPHCSRRRSWGLPWLAVAAVGVEILDRARPH